MDLEPSKIFHPNAPLVNNLDENHQSFLMNLKFQVQKHGLYQVYTENQVRIYQDAWIRANQIKS